MRCYARLLTECADEVVDAEVHGVSQLRQRRGWDADVIQGGCDHVVDTAVSRGSKATGYGSGPLVIGMVEQAGRHTVNTRFEEQWIVGVPSSRGHEKLHCRGLEFVVMRVEQRQAGKLPLKRCVKKRLAEKDL